MVIESKLGVGWDVFYSKKSNANITQNCPFLSFAVGLTRMVHESRKIAARPGVNHSVVVQCQEIVSFFSSILFIFEAAAEFVVVDEFSYVLDDKVTLFDLMLSFESPAFSSRVEWVELRILSSLKTLILA